MALLIMIVRKMMKNRWLELSLLFGLIITVALASSMPTYTNAILQRMLIKDLQNLQKDSNQFPGKFYSSVYLEDKADGASKGKQIHKMDAFIEQDAVPGLGIPILSYMKERTTATYSIEPADPTKIDPKKKRSSSISALSGIESHVRLLDGRLPSAEPVNGVYEALVTDVTLTKLEMVLGNEFVFIDKDLNKPIVIKPVGVFDVKESMDVYWAINLSTYNGAFIIPFDLFEKDFITGDKLRIKSSYWYAAFDYEKIKLENIPSYNRSIALTKNYLADRSSYYTVNSPAQGVITTYFDKEKKLRLILWSLNVPVMIMLGFYLYMVSNLIMMRQKAEIAVLRSRGASRWQIMTGYVIEGVLLGVLALAAGPFAGMLLTKILGSANGFLEFVQRASLDVRLSREAYRYSLIAVASSLVMTLIPALLATRTSIVGHKQQVARQKSRSFWHTFFLDVVLVAVSLYGLQNFRRRMDDLQAHGLDSLDFKIDPLLFLVPALFVLGTALLILRLYPWFIRLVYWAGKKWWSPSLYSTLIQVGRSGIQYQFIMVFIGMTIATGVFNASAARTLNTNMEEQVLYTIGADVALKIKWENDAPPPPPPGIPAQTQTADSAGGAPGTSMPKKVQYSEPPFLPIAGLPSVENAAKVFYKKQATIRLNNGSVDSDLLGIDTDDFGRVAWLRDGLLQHHMYEYLNLIAVDPSAVLISRSIAEEMSAKPGDHVSINWGGTDSASFIVYGIIDFWPTWNPNPQQSKDGGDAVLPKLVVGHLSYIQNNIGLEPYSIWLKLKPDATSEQFYRSLEEKNIPVEQLDNARQQLVRSKNDPFRMAINGVMTLGFIISALISFFGFLLYWILSLSGRVLQFGILRAMGISYLQLIGMLACEQILTSGAAIVMGFAIGNATGQLFVPLFQLSINPATQVPPFHVIFDPRDQLQLYVIVFLMVAIGLSVLSYMLSRIKIHQAVKLGED